MKSLEAGLACLLVCCLLATTIEYHRNIQEYVAPVLVDASQETSSIPSDSPLELQLHGGVSDFIPHPIWASSLPAEFPPGLYSQDPAPAPFLLAGSQSPYFFLPHQLTEVTFGKWVGAPGFLLCNQIQ